MNNIKTTFTQWCSVERIKTSKDFTRMMINFIKLTMTLRESWIQMIKSMKLSWTKPNCRIILYQEVQINISLSMRIGLLCTFETFILTSYLLRSSLLSSSRYQSSSFLHLAVTFWLEMKTVNAFTCMKFCLPQAWELMDLEESIALTCRLVSIPGRMCACNIRYFEETHQQLW